MFRSRLWLLSLSALGALALLVVTNAMGDSTAAATPFDGKTLSGWKYKGDDKKSKWKVGKAALDPKDANKFAFEAGEGELVNTTTGGVDAYTEAKFGDCLIEVEFMIPKGSNSGVYVMGEYEVQVFDSYGKPADKLQGSDLGAIYSAAVPKKNASKKPGEWQKFVIDFKAPKFEGGKKTQNALFVKVVLNDEVIHENVEMKGPTPGGITGKEAATGPVMFQGDHGPVSFRNLKVTPRK